MEKTNVALIRGAFANPWEMQNYLPLADRFNLTVFSSLRPLSKDIGLPLVKLPSPMDLPNFPYKMPVLNRLLIDAHWLFGLEEKLKGFDIAHVAETYYAYTHQALVAKRKGIIKKVISTCWEVIPHNNEGIRGRKEWKKEAIEEIDHFICPTEMARDCLIEEGCKPGKISVVRMGVDLTKFYKVSPCVAARADLNILFIGRLEKEKGIWELVEAFGELKKKYRNISLTMVGEGKEGKKIRQIRQIRLIGSLEYKRIMEEYRKADIFVLASKATRIWQEQYGMVLVEAMALGLPIVATRCGTIPEVLGNAGMMVEPGNSRQLAKALSYLLGNPKKRLEKGFRGRRRAERYFDREKTAEKIAKIYKLILQGQSLRRCKDCP